MSDKRISNRVDTLNLSYIMLNEADQIVHQGMGRTLNLSAKGTLLETAFPIELSYMVVISIGLADDLIEIKGKVAHTHRLENGMYLTGIEFIDVTDAERHMLTHFFKTHVHSFNHSA